MGGRIPLDGVLVTDWGKLPRQDPRQVKADSGLSTDY
jgi:hypothetical protein